MLNIIIAVSMLLIVSMGVNAARFEVANDGQVTGYFVGQSAKFTNILDATFSDSAPSAISINNHTSAFGQSFEYGYHDAGSFAIFSDLVTDTGDAWYSSKHMNSDGLDHLFYSSFALPDGTPALLIGFEDLKGLGDNDRNDVMAVFTNIQAIPPVHEPSTYLMMLLGLGLLGFIGSRRGEKNGH